MIILWLMHDNLTELDFNLSIHKIYFTNNTLRLTQICISWVGVGLIRYLGCRIGLYAVMGY